MVMNYVTRRNVICIRFLFIVLLLILLSKYPNSFLFALLGFYFASWLEDSLRNIRLLEEEKEKPPT